MRLQIIIILLKMNIPYLEPRYYLQFAYWIGLARTTMGEVKVGQAMEWKQSRARKIKLYLAKSEIPQCRREQENDNKMD